jgi:hypothetical protein
MAGLTPSSTFSRSFHFASDVRISLPSPPLGPIGRVSYRNGTKSSQPLHHIFSACDVVLPMVCSEHLASAIVDSSFHAGVPVIPPPAAMACDAARWAVFSYGAIEWIPSPSPAAGGLHYSGIVRGLIANTSSWPVAGMFPPRLVRAKLRASSLAYWAGGTFLQSAFEVALERTLRMALEVRSITQEQQQQQQEEEDEEEEQQQRSFRIVPSSVFDCRKISVLRGGGGSNT